MAADAAIEKVARCANIWKRKPKYPALKMRLDIAATNKKIWLYTLPNDILGASSMRNSFTLNLPDVSHLATFYCRIRG
jgi:hypothetical protein